MDQGPACVPLYCFEEEKKKKSKQKENEHGACHYQNFSQQMAVNTSNNSERLHLNLWWVTGLSVILQVSLFTVFRLPWDNLGKHGFTKFMTLLLSLAELNS